MIGLLGYWCYSVLRVISVIEISISLRVCKIGGEETNKRIITMITTKVHNDKNNLRFLFTITSQAGE